MLLKLYFRRADKEWELNDRICSSHFQNCIKEFGTYCVFVQLDCGHFPDTNNTKVVNKQVR